DDVGRAEACREIELPGRSVHRDDASGTDDATALAPPEAEAAAARDRPPPPEGPCPRQPMTAPVRPAGRRAVLKTAPRPVVTPQPISATRSSGTSRRMRTSGFSCPSKPSAKDL